MPTSRGLWLLFFSFGCAALGTAIAPRFDNTLFLLGCAPLLWIFWEWLRFQYRLIRVVPRIRLHREVHDDRKAVPMLWAGGEFEVRARVTIDGPGSLPFCIIDDCPAVGTNHVAGSDRGQFHLSAERPAELRYRIETPAAGEIRFEGVTVRMADLQGFFYKRVWIRDAVDYPVLPRLSGAEGKRRGSKRHNIFPPPGIHRLRTPGGGSELLDLRDYLPGDPPKMIAWKPSARRDKLITKEFESEVPVRCTLFVDASESTRVGSPGKTMLNRLVNLSAGIAEATAADRDHVGLVVFDEQDAQVMRPARTRRHLIDMLKLLAKAAARPMPLGPAADPLTLGRLAEPLAREVHPELMDQRKNTLPFGMFWEPAFDYRRILFVLPFLLPMIVATICCLGFYSSVVLEWRWGVEQCRTVLAPLSDLATEAGIRNFYSGDPIFISEYVVLLPNDMTLHVLDEWFRLVRLTLVPALFGLLIWLLFGLSGHVNPWQADRRRRKQLGILFSALDRGAIGDETHYIHDDTAFCRRALRYLADNRADYPVQLFDAMGSYLFRSKEKLQTLSDAMNYTVARGRDNELLVVMADLVELTDDLDAVERTFRVAKARHHEVIVILPWPAEIPEPPRTEPTDRPIPKKPAELLAGYDGRRNVAREVEKERFRDYHHRYFQLRKRLGKVGALVIRADDTAPIELILDRLDRLRGVGRRR